MFEILIYVKKLDHFPDDTNLNYTTDHSSGIDLIAAIDSSILINPLERVLVPTGITIEMPSGFEAQIRPRSGLAIKHGITVLNSPGTVDNDYRGEIKIILINLGCEPFLISRKMRIAQMIIAQFTQAKIIFKSDLNDSVRGDGGFGSTGAY
jgi:dUTP pyrophosphatase